MSDNKSGSINQEFNQCVTNTILNELNTEVTISRPKSDLRFSIHHDASLTDQIRNNDRSADTTITVRNNEGSPAFNVATVQHNMVLPDEHKRTIYAGNIGGASLSEGSFNPAASGLESIGRLSAEGPESIHTKATNAVMKAMNNCEFGK